jgi:DNA (cytosine-5)-methyltransferase 1
MCRLQTFPDGLVLKCSRGEAQRLLGNAVPSLLAEVLAREIRRQLLGKPLKRSLTLLPKRAVDTPPPEPVARVPRKFTTLEGDHAEHPGEGRGNGARARQRKAA